MESIGTKKKVLAISGSTRANSTNLQLIKQIAGFSAEHLNIELYDELDSLPHFNPDLDTENAAVPEMAEALRSRISAADGVLICTPEYVFSLPGSLKNAIEWTVSTTVFTDKPVALITASGLGEKAHESLQLIMKTLGARLDAQTQLLIRGARSKIGSDGSITDAATLSQVKALVSAFTEMLNG